MNFLGKKGEELATEFLQKKGYKIIKNNYKNKIGEIDIVAKHDKVLIFIEVKARKNLNFGLPQEAVGFKKQKKLKAVALKYLQDKNYQGEWRIDVVSVLFSNKGFKPQIELIKNAVIEV